MTTEANPTPLLTITPLKPSEIPPEERIIAEGKTLIESSVSWKAGKTYFDVVKTSTRGKLAGDGAPWHCRYSVHKPDEITFDQLWEKLSRNKAENELQFIHEIQKVNKIKELSPTASIWTLYYTFLPPVSPRVFTVVQVVHLSEEKPRTGLIVSLSIDLTSKGDEELHLLEEKGTKGRYVSVERVMELEDGTTEWRMATSSTPGGNIPNFLVESTMAKKIASDVPQFIKWFQKSTSKK
ncbi:hypothetical protein JR316_0003856 [Psilocybe cubensis]|uniref:Uncharacterized protein n=2 Tax=Psilocybe cubensis TaxID=181762 RepID=A0ACB8H8P8_PSICU|nr:hypothetical protein JR316_0003856 [Psilocybe cubensis]KAH9484375.1 hypothetical protein JR316_0003856 [Psilocybe cubensis]